MNYTYLIDRYNNERIIRIRYPAFTATIKDAYDPDCSGSSLTFDGKKICLDELMQECPESKLNWALKEAVKHYKFAKSKRKNGKD